MDKQKFIEKCRRDLMKKRYGYQANTSNRLSSIIGFEDKALSNSVHFISRKTTAQRILEGWEAVGHDLKESIALIKGSH